MAAPVLDRFVHRYRGGTLSPGKVGSVCVAGRIRGRKLSGLASLDTLAERTRVAVCGRVGVGHASGVHAYRRDRRRAAPRLRVRDNRRFLQPRLHPRGRARLLPVATPIPDCLSAAPATVTSILVALRVPDPDRYSGLRAVEYLLREGDEVEVTGKWTRVADETGEALRETPWRNVVVAELLRYAPRLPNLSRTRL